MNGPRSLFRHCVAVIAVLATGAVSALAQDTIRINLQQAEQQFLQNNLMLLAARYNIDAARAQIIQAKLYNNPNIAISAAIYNPDQHKVFDVSSSTGQYGISIQQMIILAGKRNKQVALAETNALMTEYNFYDLLRTLRFSLRSNYYSMLHLHQSYGTYQVQINSLEKLSSAYNDLQAKGVVTLKDAVRIKSLLYTLQGEQTSLQNQLNDVQAEFRLLMRDNKHYYLPADTSGIATATDQFPLQALVDSAYNNRFDLKAAEANMTYSEQNYRLQKALRTPDLTLGAEFDRRGSYVNNATLLNAAIDLPFFNRNQGNIKAAKIGIDQSKAQQQLQQQMVENEVQKAYIKALNTERILQSFDPGFKDQFGQLLKGITENFEKRNISLLEFTDFYESYKDNILRINQLQNEKDQAKEALNFAVGKTLFN